MFKKITDLELKHRMIGIFASAQSGSFSYFHVREGMERRISNQRVKYNCSQRSAMNSIVRSDRNLSSLVHKL